MLKAYQDFWKNRTVFDGRTVRKDYWFSFLVNNVVRLVIVLVQTALQAHFTQPMITAKPGTTEYTKQATDAATSIAQHMPLPLLIVVIIGTLWSLAILWPVMNLTARRLRDAAFAPGLAYGLIAVYVIWALAAFLPLPGFLTMLAAVYGLILLVMCLFGSREIKTVEKV
ncbi:MAG: DUF805 domain-containing protein [Streptococcaceae bacterium]|jgi:uncharacterized membrane protein YhaH (DUF805 family)|nr:DUF805 domain-containing protein [Streptococcaceae bacterium]